MEYKCSLCQETVEGDILVYIEHTQKHIVDEIKTSHPEWVEDQGICPKCVEYFKNQMQGKE